jgi:hypothetical protein
MGPRGWAATANGRLRAVPVNQIFLNESRLLRGELIRCTHGLYFNAYDR